MDGMKRPQDDKVKLKPVKETLPGCESFGQSLLSAQHHSDSADYCNITAGRR